MQSYHGIRKLPEIAACTESSTLGQALLNLRVLAWAALELVLLTIRAARLGAGKRPTERKVHHR